MRTKYILGHDLGLIVSDSLDASFVPWSSDLRTHLLAKYPLPANVEPVSEDTFLEPTWKLALQSGVQNGVGYGATTVPPSIPASHLNPQSQTKGPQKSSSTGMLPLPVTLQNNSRMTPQNHWQDVRHLVFTSELHADYGPGDILTIHPENQEVDVEQLLIRMNWVDVADKPIIYSPTNSSDTNDKAFLSSPKHTAITTLRSLLRTQLDITAIPRRSFFSFIAHFTDDQFHKDRLLEFTKPDYIDEFYDYTTRPRRSILEVLQEFESVNVPWQWAGSVFPELRGRQFSIASGGIHKTTLTGTARFELLVAIVKYRTVIKKMREGVCTRYLSSLAVGTRLDVTLQKGSLAIKKKDTNLPVIMIGPGTGIAPMRSLIWERRHWLQDEYRESLAKTIHDIDRNPAKYILFFGCRNESADYFYREEWEDIQKSVPLEVYAAFSRDQRQKVYVQDLIRKNSRSVFYVLHNDGGLVYVSGSSGKMPLAVRAALVDVFRECGDMDQGTAEEYLESLEKGGRYRQETW